MGKGNRIRNQKAGQQSLAVSTRKDVKKKKAFPTWAGTAIVLAIVLALVLSVVMIALNSAGVFVRGRVVVESEHYEITVPMMSYLVQMQCDDVIAANREYAESFKEILGDSYSASMFPIKGGDGGDNLDQTKDLRSQIYSRVKAADGTVIVTTWFEYFSDVARTKAQQMLVMCEKANAIGMSLSESEIASIDAQISIINLYAQIYGVTTSGYLTQTYGDGVAVKDVRAMLEISQLSAKYAALKLEEFQNGVDLNGDRVTNHYNDNKEIYDIYMDFVGHTFTATFTPSTNKNTTQAAEENAANKAAYEAEQAKYKERMEQLAAVTTVEEFTTMLQRFLREDALEAEMEAALKDKPADKKELTELEIADCNNRADAKVLASMKAATRENFKKGSATLDSEIEQWLFKTEEKGEGDEKITVFVRKVNDIKDKKVETTVETTGDKAYKAATSTYTVYIVAGEHHRSTGLSVGHILFKADTYKDLTSTSKLSGVIKSLADEVLAKEGKVNSKGMAKRLLEVMMERELLTKVTDPATNTDYYTIKPDAFEEYGSAYTGDSNVTYHDVVLNQMVEEFENWMFAEGRHENEITYPAGVDTDFGTHIMFYYGESWRVAIKEELANADYEKFCEDLLDEVSVTFNDNHWNYVCKH